MRTFICTLLVFASAALGIETKEIEYTHGDLTLKGYLAFDASVEEPRPGVLIVHEWWGMNEYAKGRARQLAEAGYVAFALDMFGEGRTTSEVSEAQSLVQPMYEDRTVMRARAARGLEVLREQEQVDASRIAVIGYCFGGTTALELARDGADVRGIVSFHGGLNTTMPAEAGQMRSKVLVLTGGDDPMVPDAEVNAFVREMEAAEADYQVIVYGSAAHSFTNPEADAKGIPGVRYDAAADRRSWGHMEMFFDEIFAEGSP